MKKLLNNLIGRDVIVHLKSGEVLSYLTIIDVVENTLVASYGNTIYLIEIGHIGQVIVGYTPDVSPQDMYKSGKDENKNESSSDKNDGDKKDDKKGDKKDGCDKK
jgi:small nuclear ribonucleoprotein (snRNP)-like protein